MSLVPTAINVKPNRILRKHPTDKCLGLNSANAAPHVAPVGRPRFEFDLFSDRSGMHATTRRKGVSRNSLGCYRREQTERCFEKDNKRGVYGSTFNLGLRMFRPSSLWTTVLGAARPDKGGAAGEGHKCPVHYSQCTRPDEVLMRPEGPVQQHSSAQFLRTMG